MIKTEAKKRGGKGNNRREEEGQKDEENTKDSKLSSKEVDKITYFINQEMNPEKICSFMDAEPGSSFEAAILERVKMIDRPPLPYPENCRKIISRKTGETMLPLFHYVGK